MPRWLIAIVLLLIGAPALGQLPVVRNRTDLPSVRFTLTEPPRRAFASRAFATEVAPRLRVEAERILAGYRIENANIGQRLRMGLAALDIIQGRGADALRRIAAERAADTKPQIRAVGFLTMDAIAASLAVPQPRRCAAAADRIRQSIAGTDAGLIRDELLSRYRQIEVASVPYFAAAFVDADAAHARQGSVDIVDAMIMATARVFALELPPCRAPMTAVLRRWLDDPAHGARDIWAAREPAADSQAGGASVVVAVWDTGVDVGLFPGRLVVDPAEPLDLRDNDGNGVVDDVHGPTYDFRLAPSPHALAPLSDFLRPRLAFFEALGRGSQDLNLGLDSDEARLLIARSREGSAEDQIEDERAFAEIGFRSHGTFVASEIADGLPAVRLFIARLVPGGRNPDRVYTSEPENDRLIAAIPRLVDRMRGSGVRIVNMSWDSLFDGGDSLLQGNLESDAVRARARAETMHRRLRDAFAVELARASDILFVVAAGNDNQPGGPLAALPQAIGAPNVIVVGAASQSGVPTSFTAFGEGVHIYARGQNVAGRFPGGMSGTLSGTSMAAPLVARAAAQMLSVNPDLTPAQLIEGLLATATPGEEGMRLLHPAQAVAWARRQRAR